MNKSFLILSLDLFSDSSLFVIYFVFNQYSNHRLCQSRIDEFIDALIEKGDELADQNRYDEAIQYYDKALEMTPDDVETLLLKR